MDQSLNRKGMDSAEQALDLDCVDVNEIMAMFGDWTLRLDVQVG